MIYVPTIYQRRVERRLCLQLEMLVRRRPIGAVSLEKKKDPRQVLQWVHLYREVLSKCNIIGSNATYHPNQVQFPPLYTCPHSCPASAFHIFRSVSYQFPPLLPPSNRVYLRRRAINAVWTLQADRILVPDPLRGGIFLTLHELCPVLVHGHGSWCDCCLHLDCQTWLIDGTLNISTLHLCIDPMSWTLCWTLCVLHQNSSQQAGLL